LVNLSLPLQRMQTPYRLICLLFFTGIFYTTLFAQRNTYIGITAGISVPNLTAGSNNPLSSGYETSLGADCGIFAEFTLNHWLSIQPGINYSQEGGQRNGLQPLINPYPDISPQPYLYANYHNAVQLNYLLFPIMAKFKFNITKKLQFFFNVGGFGGMLLGAKTMSSGESHVYMDPAGTIEQPLYPGAIFPFGDTTDIKDSAKSFNAGVIAFVGFSYTVGRGKLFIEAGGNYGLIGVQKNPANGTNYAGAVTAHIGYAYALRRRKKK
jgi:hypothetical protein